jgi:hypothetical protein
MRSEEVAMSTSMMIDESCAEACDADDLSDSEMAEHPDTAEPRRKALGCCRVPAVLPDTFARAMQALMQSE